uniref:Addiction module component n=1 Tax=Candidatus Kentrum sp. LFY TaxID=2126342 RepID=A0A450UGB7_9GAMM|nr:MAG: Putative addiction module component [Candidatus Kentron sp. LFY]VFJ97227.1 MAG: Putative addiction module component [Candidatus Kentron sp. LFY]
MKTNLLETALEMPPSERVEFAELILASIDYEEHEIRQSWIEEVKTRFEAVNEGQAGRFRGLMIVIIGNTAWFVSD